MTFGKKIEKLCEEKGWNRAELARRCRVSKTTAGYWWDGVRRPYDDSLVLLTELLGVSADYLIDDDLDAPPEPALTEDERLLLEVARATEGGPREALKRIVNPTKPPYVGGAVIDLNPRPRPDGAPPDENVEVLGREKIRPAPKPRQPHKKSG